MACEDCNWILEPGKILRIRPTGDTRIWKIPVQFQSYTDEDASWEPMSIIQHQFPRFDLGDKVSFGPDGNVQTPIMNV